MCNSDGTVFPEPVGRGNGAVYLLDNTYSTVATVTLSGIFNELTPGATFPSNIDLHEVNITPRGTVLVTANNVTNTDLTSVGGPKNGWVSSFLAWNRQYCFYPHSSVAVRRHLNPQRNTPWYIVHSCCDGSIIGMRLDVLAVNQIISPQMGFLLIHRDGIGCGFALLRDRYCHQQDNLQMVSFRTPRRHSTELKCIPTWL